MTRRTGVKALVAALFGAAIVAFVVLGGPRYVSPGMLEANRDALLRFADAHPIAAPAMAFGAYAGFVSLGLPGGLVFSLACGLLFGRWAGTLVAICGETVGATIAFLLARYLFADAARRRLGAAGERINAGFTRHAFSYLLFLRVVPVFPFFLVNIAPAFTTVAVRTYVVGTLIGAIPATFVYANLGETLGRASSLAEALSPATLGGLALLGLLALLPVLVSKARARAARRRTQET